ncbi:ABC transporter substrate-binding protein (plasmid) [Gemmobacter fulvus]|uniref:ABC transporter substrate-binding protein n=1 Tax=Gemmobacter fulvus TaxID=2840474 RepID=A0A975S2X9_9RHOB|nr:ABC transporter substrate-binding protein [Gemmobacter fulvus]MBT9246087.1 ABC transporter substrate-binding protein [Gemmobacter fulvus]QWK92152.1 ABC transporter substrate-binding protein [Gemmobacter fulvus]
MRKLLAIGLATLLASPVAAQSRDLTVTAWGGAVQDAKRDIMFTPFGTEKGIRVLDDVYDGGWAPFKAMQDTGVIPWDVVQVETAELVRGCEEGIFMPIDWTKIGPKDSFYDAAVSECGVGTVIWSVVMAFNESTIGTAPTTVANFFDLQTWPGKRGMRRGPKINLEFALMADGVAPADVYTVLATPEGVDRAFAKLDTIKSSIQWWNSGAQPAEWLVSGDVTMALAYNGRISAALDEGRPLGILWENTLYDADAWVIPAGTPYPDLAHELIAYASDAQRQADFSNRFAYGPTVPAAMDLVDAARVPMLPAGDNLDTALFLGSEAAREFWQDNLEDLTVRFNTWSGVSN